MKVLFLTHRLPYAPNRGDRVRAYFLLRTMGARASVDVVSLVHDEQEASQVGAMASLATSVRVARVPRLTNLVRSAVALPSTRPTTHSMLDSPGLRTAISAAVAATRPDVVLAYGSGMARFALMPPLRSIPFVMDMVDVDSAKWDALARVTRVPLAWVYRREANVLARFEAFAAARAVASLVVTERERATLHRIAPSSRILILPNGVDVETLRPRGDPADSSTVVFCGVMNYPPNEQAAALLARDVWPLVRRQRPDATLQIVGATPSRLVASLTDSSRGVEVTGSVPDVKPFLWSAAAAAAPILTARGIQNKVLEAVAAGLPTVVTPNIFESLPAGVRPGCLAATGARGLADAIVSVLNMSPDERRARASRAELGSLTWDRQLEPINNLLSDAASGRLSASVTGS